MKSLLTALLRIAAALERLADGGGPRRLMTQDQVAALFAHEGNDWWLRNKDQLMDKAGFPAPIAGTKGNRWDPRAIALWQDRQMAPELAGTAPEQHDAEAVRNRLRARGREILAGIHHDA